MASPTTGILDTFTDTNGTSLPTHGGWSTLANLNQDNVIQSNAATGIGGDLGVDMWSTIASGANQENHIVITTKGGTGEWIMLFTRMTTLDYNTTDGYYLEITPVAGTDEWRLFEAANLGVSGASQLGLAAAAEVANGDQIFLDATSSTLSAHQNGTEVISRTDATYGSAGYHGLGLGGSAVRADSYGGGQAVAAFTRYLPKAWP